ncbi:hypothetical protein [Companilactobacillus sp. DQM5]|uniref:hypothetical protein n=1 Tax=Companilactobacillus sp. DQM5 TaxID=3463359 RepID=UPI00405A2FF7
MKEIINKHKSIVIGVAVILLIIIGFVWHNYNASRLEGSYTGKVTVLFTSTKDTMTFSKDKTFKDGSNKGTYEIDKDELKMKFKDGTRINADLSKDRKSFEITSASGLVDMASGTKYIKNK